MKSNNPEALHARGIMMARLMASKLVYNNKGNEAFFTVKHDNMLERQAPEGFAKADAISVEKGSIVFREGEPSDFLYYITSGRYSVFHKSSQFENT